MHLTDNQLLARRAALPAQSAANKKNDPNGPEHNKQCSISVDPSESDANSRAVSADSGAFASELALIASVWPTLPNVIREAVLATQLAR